MNAQPDEIQTLDTEINALAQRARQIAVVDEDSCIAARKLLVTFKEADKRIDEVIGPFVKDAHETWKKAKARENALREPLVQARAIVLAPINAYETKKLVDAREEQRKRDEEARRLREEQAQRDALALEAAGKTEEAAKMVDAALSAPVAAPRPVVVQTSKVAGTRTVTRWDFEIVDKELIPRKWMIVNEQAIRTHIKALKENAEPIPGVRFTSTKEVQ